MQQENENATDVSPASDVTDLRTELLEHRARTVTWWLTGTAAFLTLVTLIAVVSGVISFVALRDVTKEAEANADRAKESADMAAHYERLSEESYQRTLSNEDRIDQLTIRIVASQSQRRESLDHLVQQSETLLRVIDYEPFDLRKEGRATNDEEQDFSWDLEHGFEYQLVGVCDENCTDLDLILLDSSGNQVVQDLLVDDVPILEITPPQTETYVVRVRMATCSENSCAWRVDAYRRNRDRGVAEE